MIRKEEAIQRGFEFFLDGLYQKVYIPEEFANANKFALEVCFQLRPLVAIMLGREIQKLNLLIHSKDNKVVFLSYNPFYRAELATAFGKKAMGIAVVFTDQSVEAIEAQLDKCVL